MKIFIGTHENCGIIHNLENGFKQLGHTVTSCVKSRDSFFNVHKYTLDLATKDRSYFNIPIIRSLFFKLNNYKKHLEIRNIFHKNIIENDLFIYTWDTLLPNLYDLEVLKKRNKKIVFLFIGSDIRNAQAFSQQYPNISIPWPDYIINSTVVEKLNFIRPIEYYADLILSVPDQSGLLIRPYDHLYLPFRVDSVVFKIPNNETLRIVHAPSIRDIKGTSHVLGAIDKLKKEGFLFDFILLENKTNDVVLKELELADIAIDQVYLHGPAMFATEAMASGCAVATNYLEEYKDIFPAPVCSVNEFNLYEGIKKLITDKEYRLNLANQGRQFVENFNNPVQIAKEILNRLDQPMTKHDYKPLFFINSFNLEEDDNIPAKLKELTKQILSRYYSPEEKHMIINILENRRLL
jgi:hypothetical protein